MKLSCSTSPCCVVGTTPSALPLALLECHRSRERRGSPTSDDGSRSGAERRGRCYPALSVGCVVAGTGRVDVVVVAVEPVAGVVVLVVVVVVVGATKGESSPRASARLEDGVAARFVQLRAAFHDETAAVAGEPLRGWGSPPRMVAGRKVTDVMCRPMAVRMSDPLLVSGAVLS